MVLKIYGLKDEEEKESWDSGLRMVTECPYMYYSKTILISKELIDMAEMLSNKLLGYEWLMYCEADEDGSSIMIHSCIIPEQEVTSASVDVKKGMNLPVVVHSHHNLGTGEFSIVDDEYINSNHGISILWTNRRGITEVVVRKNLPCGNIALIKVDKVMVYIPSDYSVDEVKAKVESQIGNIKKKDYTYRYPYTGYGYYDYLDEVEREYRKLIGGYDDEWWEKWEDEEEVTGEEASGLWKER